jgi:hypothetical protein
LPAAAASLEVTVRFVPTLTVPEGAIVIAVADVDEDLVVAAGSVRGRLRSGAFFPFEPVFAGIRARSWR